MSLRRLLKEHGFPSEAADKLVGAIELGLAASALEELRGRITSLERDRARLAAVEKAVERLSGDPTRKRTGDL
jgi:hypothetical protein